MVQCVVVLGWLRKRKDGEVVSPEQRALLESWLEPLAGGLAQRARDYILSGQGEGVIETLAADEKAGIVLGLKLCRMGPPRPYLAELLRAGLPDAGLYLRIARVIEAAQRSSLAVVLRRSSGGGLPTSARLPGWLDALLWEASTYEPNVYKSGEVVHLSHEVLEAVLTEAGDPPDTILGALIATDPVRDPFRFREMLAGIAGLRDAVARHAPVIRAGLEKGDAKQRAFLLGVLRAAEVDPAPLLDLLAAAACDDAKSVRELGEAWLASCGEGAALQLRRLVCDGPTSTRARAAELLARLGGAGERSFLQQRATEERSAPVRRAIEAALASLSSEVATSVAPVTLPPVGPGPLPPLGADARIALGKIADSWHEDASRSAMAARLGHRPSKSTSAALDEWLELMQSRAFSLSAADGVGLGSVPGFWGGDWLKRARPLLSVSNLTLGHLVRFAVLARIAVVHDHYAGIGGHGLLPLVKAFQRARGLTFGLRELAAELEAVGIEARRLAVDLVFTFRRSADGDWTDAEVWPFFWEHVSLLEVGLGLAVPPPWLRRAWYLEHRVNALAILARMPQPPPSLEPFLWQLALGSARGDRLAARKCLRNVPGSTQRVLAALSEGKQEEREAAAEWLAAAGDALAVPPLRKALAREKGDRGKAAIMVALEALGANLDDLVDRESLSREAGKGLAKGVPRDLGWFPFTQLPEVRWSNGTPLPPSIITWWIVQARKLGSPEPGPLLRCYAARLCPADAEALGRFVLEAWLAEDTRLPSEAEVQAKAPALAAQAQQHASFFNLTPEQYLDQALEAARSTPVGSAIADKGVLAVAAMAGAAAAPLVARYLKQWYGLRAAQCKALVQMLAWVEHPTAASVLLATATRFRTAGIRQAAEAAVTALAERRGWSVDELADRTIPSADLDDDGVLELSFGPRSFRARLKPDLTLAIEDDHGTALSGLPEPRATDDAKAAAGAKQRLSVARKQLKTIEKQQRERLLEAMCAQRMWRFDDWQTYLANHPVVRHLCTRLVWGVRVDGRPTVSFRPLGDGSLTGPDDAAVAIPAEATIAVAHPLLLSQADVAAWQRHFADYEIAPLFDQMGQPPRHLPDEMKADTEIAAFEGYIVEAFKLRGRATKLGYVRGPAEDGGWFFCYKRSFPTLQLEAELAFSGNSLPEENRKVALGTLRFQRGGREASEPMPLGEVPAVLLSECWNDLATIAADGPGYEPDWQTKVNP